MDQKSIDSRQNPQAVMLWLLFCAGMVFCMAVIGAVTRLTESGLSMAEWRPLIGALPPLSDVEWHRVFDLYKETPEFQKKNMWMALGDFKTIFFWEWFHRLWGRLIGVVYALPLLFFWLRGMIPQGYKPWLLGGLVLGGLQGVMGWYMVKSGLVDRPSVSHFRLAAHLGLAFLIYSYLLWLALSLWRTATTPAAFCLRRHGWIALLFLVITILYGAFTAGLDGGMVYNTWPHMDAHWIPPEVTGGHALISTPAAVQFVHRWLAIATGAFLLSFAWRVRGKMLAGMTLVQILLGISTLLTQVWIPLAAMHQAGAFLLIGLMVFHLHRLHGRGRNTMS